jgi:hypothetical protein
MKHRLTTQELLEQLLPEERRLVEWEARNDGIRPDQFTPEQINLCLAQARHIGELAERTIN